MAFNYGHSGSYFNPGDRSCSNGLGGIYFSPWVPLLYLLCCKIWPTCTPLNEGALWCMLEQCRPVGTDNDRTANSASPATHRLNLVPSEARLVDTPNLVQILALRSASTLYFDKIKLRTTTNYFLLPDLYWIVHLSTLFEWRPVRWFNPFGLTRCKVTFWCSEDTTVTCSLWPYGSWTSRTGSPWQRPERERGIE